jgi:hypothetical protein
MNLPQIHRVYRGWIRGLEYGTRREVQRFSLIFRRGALCEPIGTLLHSARCRLSASYYSLTWNPTSLCFAGIRSSAISPFC